MKEKPVPIRADPHSPSVVFDAQKLCWHGPILEGYRMKSRIWAGCCFISQILYFQERMVGVKWQPLKAPATLGMLGTDTSILNSNIFRKWRYKLLFATSTPNMLANKNKNRTKTPKKTKQKIKKKSLLSPHILNYVEMKSSPQRDFLFLGCLWGGIRKKTTAPGLGINSRAEQPLSSPTRFLWCWLQ